VSSSTRHASGKHEFVQLRDVDVHYALLQIEIFLFLLPIPSVKERNADRKRPDSVSIPPKQTQVVAAEPVSDDVLQAARE
jgi:hypothetical protein